MTFRKKHYVFVPLLILSCVVFFSMGSNEVSGECGDQKLQEGEDCDWGCPGLGFRDKDGVCCVTSCPDYDDRYEYSGGLECNDDCTVDTSGCCVGEGGQCSNSPGNKCCESKDLECQEGECVKPTIVPECADSDDCCDACSGDNYCAYCKYDDTCACYSCPCSSSEYDCGCPETTTTTTTPGATTTTTTITTITLSGCYSQCHNSNCFYPDCICSSGEGDCDGEEDCKSGLICCFNVGSHFGCSSTDDICLSQSDCDDLKTGTTTTTPGATTTTTTPGTTTIPGALNQFRFFDRLYLSKKGDKEIRAAIEGSGFKSLVLEYKNYNSDICTSVNVFNDNYGGIFSSIKCEKKEGENTYYVLAQGGEADNIDPNKIWNDLTAKLR